MKLKRLIQLQQLKVEQQRLFLQPLQNRINELEREIAILQQNVKNERHIAAQSIEGAMAYGHYVQEIHTRCQQAEKYLKEARVKLAQELQRLQDMAALQKVYEKVKDQQHQAHQQQLDKEAQYQLEEKVPYRIKVL